MDIDTLQRLARLLKYSGYTPPRDVLWAVASLLDVENAEVDPALLSWKVEKDGTTTWHVFGLTPDLIMTVTADADRVPWSYDSEARNGGHAPANSMTAAVRRRASVSRIDVDGLEGINNWPDRAPTEWRTAWRIHFDDGGDFQLPVAEQWALKTDEAARSLLADLRGR
ncbi:hypothetical protein WBG06_16235 [Nocardioides sp. CCNWLW239]|uniref:hypothetical protein n=1 Tax=Nocardioides sp. CCNWLW239 TaxID=3128902 RepID=UPI0030173272